MDLRLALQDKFGFKDFYPGQEDVVLRVLRRQEYLGNSGNGRRQEPHLPALRALARGHDARRQPADRPYEGPARHAARPRRHRPSRSTPRLTLEEQEARARERIASGGAPIVFTTPEKLEDAGFLDLLQVHRVPLFVDGRGPLHQPMGPRLPSRLPRARRHHRQTRPPDGSRAHGNRHAFRTRGYSAPAGHDQVEPIVRGSIARISFTKRARPARKPTS